MDISNWGPSTWATALAVVGVVYGGVVTFWSPGKWPLKLLALVGFVVLGLASIRVAREQEKRTEQAEREAKAAHKQVMESQQRLEALTTGGDSYCYLALSDSDGKTAIPAFHHAGKNPLQDVKYRLVDAATGNVIVADSLGTLAVDTTYANLKRVPVFDGMAINAFFEARNGLWRQTLRVRRIGGRWVQAVSVWRTPSNKPEELVFEGDYPRRDTKSGG